MNAAPRIVLFDQIQTDIENLVTQIHSAFGNGDQVMIIRDWEEAIYAAGTGAWDIFLVASTIEGRRGSEIIHHITNGTPVIIIADLENSTEDEAALRAGAADFLIRGQITGASLNRAIRYAIAERTITLRQAQQTLHDPLTGLANRGQFIARTADAIAHSRRSERRMALITFNCSRFGQINQAIGREAADRLLRSAAMRVASAMRTTDLIGRIGGDQFAVLATNLVHPAATAALARKIASLMAEPFAEAGEPIHIAISAGAALFPDDAIDATGLMDAAEVALNEARHAGPGSFRLYDTGLDAEIRSRRTLETELVTALERHEFILDFQPKIQAASGTVTGVEALVRWRHPRRGILPPGAFLPVVEGISLLEPLESWVLRAACQQIRDWQVAGMPAMAVSVNISARHLLQENFVAKVSQIIRDTGIDPSQLEIEIKESVTLIGSDKAEARIRSLAAIGVAVAIDDFGTGASSLEVVSRLPLSRLKIDRSFVAGVERDERRAAIARAIITLGRHLNMRVLAEGVETEGELDFLRGEGCEEVQGFHFARPLSPDNFQRWYAQGRGAA